MGEKQKIRISKSKINSNKFFYCANEKDKYFHFWNPNGDEYISVDERNMNASKFNVL